MSTNKTMKEDTVINLKDIDHSWANSMSEELNALQLMKMSSNAFTICRVPLHVRKGMEMYYDPAMVSIGPYHQGRKEFQTMELKKLKYLKGFLARNTNNTLQEYMSMLRKVEDRARRCYFDYIDLKSEEFVKMLLVDGCFIIEFFLLERRGGTDIRLVGWFYARIVTDLMLLENQIPFFVINMLFKLLVRGIRARSEEERSTYDLGIVKIICDSFDHEVPMVEDDDIHHLLGLLYSYKLSPSFTLGAASDTKSPIFSFVKLKLLLSNLLKPLRLALLHIYPIISSEQKETKSRKAAKIPCASKLVEHGIKFKTNNRNYKINFSYKYGVLEIPEIDMDEGKYILFNCLAFEQCNLGIRSQVLSSYYQFMDLLIDTSKDVEILEECGILVSHMKSTEDTAFFFNQFNDYGLFIRKADDLLQMYQEINKFCDSKWHRYRAKLNRDYFSNPWSILSLIAAVILLILTFLQTFFSIYK